VGRKIFLLKSAKKHKFDSPSLQVSFRFQTHAFLPPRTDLAEFLPIIDPKIVNLRDC
jgi:hypothetical protein